MESCRQQFFKYRRQLLKPVSLHSVVSRSRAISQRSRIFYPQEEGTSLFSCIKNFISTGCSKLASLFKFHRNTSNHQQLISKPETRYVQSRNRLYLDLKNYSQLNSISQYEKKLEESFGEGLKYQEQFNPFLVPRSRIGIKNPTDRRLLPYNNQHQRYREVSFPASKLSIQIVNQYNKRQNDKSIKSKSQRYNQLMRSNRTKKQFINLDSKILQMQKKAKISKASNATRQNKNTQMKSKKGNQRISESLFANTAPQQAQKIFSNTNNKLQDGKQMQAPQTLLKIDKNQYQIRQKEFVNYHKDLMTIVQTGEEKQTLSELQQEPIQTENQDQEKEKQKPSEDQKRINQTKLITKSVNTNDQQTEKSSSLLSKIDRQSVTLQNLMANQKQQKKQEANQTKILEKNNPTITQQGGQFQQPQFKEEQGKSQQDEQESKQKYQAIDNVEQKINQPEKQSQPKIQFQDPISKISSNLFAQTISPMSSLKKSGSNIFALKPQQSSLNTPLFAPKESNPSQKKSELVDQKIEKKGLFDSKDSLFKKNPFVCLFQTKKQEDKPHEKQSEAQKESKNNIMNPNKPMFPKSDDFKQNLFKTSQSKNNILFPSKIPKLSYSKTSPFSQQNKPKDEEEASKPLFSLFSKINEGKPLFPKSNIFNQDNKSSGGIFQSDSSIKTLFSGGNQLFGGKKQVSTEKFFNKSEKAQDDSFEDLFDEPSKKKQI